MSSQDSCEPGHGWQSWTSGTQRSSYPLVQSHAMAQASQPAPAVPYTPYQAYSQPLPPSQLSSGTWHVQPPAPVTQSMYSPLPSSHVPASAMPGISVARNSSCTSFLKYEQFSLDDEAMESIPAPVQCDNGKMCAFQANLVPESSTSSKKLKVVGNKEAAAKHGGRQLGSANYNNDDLPFNAWALRNSMTMHETKNLKNKFKMLVCTRKPMGDAEILWYVKQAKQIDNMINEWVCLQVIDDSGSQGPQANETSGRLGPRADSTSSTGCTSASSHCLEAAEFFCTIKATLDPAAPEAHDEMWFACQLMQSELTCLRDENQELQRQNKPYQAGLRPLLSAAG
ncbi:hypothetical protein C8Q73DRAFT_666643 [Cubamyces lactineus]|nr:hypothetical protein C8Q73DRAFT_666643 [Cubamyces lactineus]